MIRTADAAGIDAVVLGEGTADPYNGKTPRSAQGSHFHIPILKRPLDEFTAELKSQGVAIYGTALENGAAYQSVKPEESFALIVGNEGGGSGRRPSAKNGSQPVRSAVRAGGIAECGGSGRHPRLSSQRIGCEKPWISL